MAQSSPTQLHIAKGELVLCQGQEYVVLRVVDLTQVLARCVSTNETKLVEIKHLSPWVAKIDEAPDKKDIDLLDVAEKDWEEARRRLEAIRPMLTRQERGSGLVDRVSSETGYSPATLYRWRDLYANSGLLTSLLPTKRSGGKGKGRISEEVEAIIKHTLDAFYLTTQKRSIKNTVDKIQRLCKTANLPVPHWNTVKNRIDWMSERERYERRFSKRAARQIFDVNEGSVPNADWPLALVQIDHTPLPVMIVHDVTRRSIGRPYVTFSIDVYSRMITGMELSLEAPSAMSAGLTVIGSA